MQNIEEDNFQLKQYNDNGYKNDVQIIQDAIDIFGGRVLR